MASVFSRVLVLLVAQHSAPPLAERAALDARPQALEVWADAANGMNLVPVAERFVRLTTIEAVHYAGGPDGGQQRELLAEYEVDDGGCDAGVGDDDLPRVD